MNKEKPTQVGAWAGFSLLHSAFCLLHSGPAREAYAIAPLPRRTRARPLVVTV